MEAATVREPVLLLPGNHFSPKPPNRFATPLSVPQHFPRQRAVPRLRLSMRIQHSALLACLFAGTLCAADDPFVGKWKVNPSKSKLTDEMKVDALGANKYVLTFGPGAVDTIVADGTDQPALQGTTLSVKMDGPNHWTVVRKKEGRTIVMGLWTLSADGQTLNDDFTAYQAGGSTIKLHYIYQRTAGSSGFTGTWDGTSQDMNAAIELQIQPYQDDGLSLNSSALQMMQSLKFDGKDYPDLNPKANPGSASSGRRADQRTLEITDKLKGKIIQTRTLHLSPDLQTLTMSMLAPGESQPKNILGFDREVQSAQAAAPLKIPMTAERWTIEAGAVNFVEYMGKPSIELQPGDYKKGIPSGMASLKDFQFGNGTIQYDVTADKGMGASIMFRAAGKENFEMFYLRPRPNCQDAPDCVQYAPQVHGALLWDVFPQYQGPAPLHSGQWNHVKLVISGKRMNIYLNGSPEPALKISRLEGDTDQGGLMLAGPGVFAGLTVQPDEVEGLPPDPEPDPAASDSRFLRHWQVSAFSKLADNQAPVYADLPDASAKWTPIEAEQGGLINVSRMYGLPLPRSQRAVVWLKTSIHSASALEKHASFGWLREAFVFVNGQLVYADKNLYQPPAARKAPDGRLSLENGSLMLPLQAGDNEIAVAVVNNFYGWGIKMRLDDVKDLVLVQ